MKATAARSPTVREGLWRRPQNRRREERERRTPVLGLGAGAKRELAVSGGAGTRQRGEALCAGGSAGSWALGPEILTSWLGFSLEIVHLALGPGILTLSPLLLD